MKSLTRSSVVVPHIWAIVCYALLALAITWPLARNPSQTLLVGAEPSATVPLLNVWTMWWNVDRLDHGYRDYWHAPIFYPADDAFTYSEPQPATGWLAYPLWKTLSSPASVYNTLTIWYLTLNGWVSFLVLRRCRIRWYLALAGGAYVTVLPVVHWQISVFQLTSLWSVALTVWTLLRFQRVPTGSRAVQVGVAFSLTYLLCCYHGLFFSVLLLFAGPLLVGCRLRQGRFWIQTAVAVAVAGLLVAPVVSAQMRTAQRRPREYRAEWLQKLAASPSDYLRTPWPQWVDPAARRGNRGPYQWPLSPGTIKTLLAAAGLCWSVWSRRRRRLGLFLGSMAAMSVLLSMGPRLAAGGVSLQAVLAEYYPGFAHVRNLYRFAFFYQWSVVLLAAFGWQALLLLAARRLPRGRRWLAGVVLTLCAVIVAFETWPGGRRHEELPDATAASSWLAWIEQNVEDDQAMVFLPLPQDQTAKSFLPTAQWMYFQTWHQRPLANGYSAMLPREYARLNRAMKEFPSVAARDMLMDTGIEYVVIDPNLGPPPDDESLRALGFTRAYVDPQAKLQFWRVD